MVSSAWDSEILSILFILSEILRWDKNKPTTSGAVGPVAPCFPPIQHPPTSHIPALSIPANRPIIHSKAVFRDGNPRAVLKNRQKLGKYRLRRRLAEGGFAAVFEATDTIEGVKVALKIPHANLVNPKMLEVFRREVRMIARLEHPNILPLKDANFIGDHFVIVFPLGERTLSDRLKKRLGVETALSFSEQLLEAVAYAHGHRIVHCDIKPENVIIFAGNRIKLTDFGIAKVAQKTIRGSGTGTVGYMAPEQAMGHPSSRSDLFSVGVIMYRMLAGKWPEWPYRWPLPGVETVRRKVHPELLAVLKRALSVDPKQRFSNAEVMLRSFRAAAKKTRQLQKARKRTRQSTG